MDLDLRTGLCSSGQPTAILEGYLPEETSYGRCGEARQVLAVHTGLVRPEVKIH